MNKQQLLERLREEIIHIRQNFASWTEREEDLVFDRWFDDDEEIPRTRAAILVRRKMLLNIVSDQQQLFVRLTGLMQLVDEIKLRNLIKPEPEPEPESVEKDKH